MKKLLAVLPIVALMAACSTSDPMRAREEDQRRYAEKAIDRAIDEAPKWMSKTPTSASAIYAAGTSSAYNYSMAVTGAMTDAKAGICYSADGKVTSQTRDFSTSNSKNNNVERVTRTNCNNVEIMGVEIAGKGNTPDDPGQNPKVIRTGDKYTAYVLLVLPTGAANVQRTYKDNLKREEQAAIRAQEAFKELPKNQ